MFVVRLLMMFTLYTLPRSVLCKRLKEGDACKINMNSDEDGDGICRPIYDCRYALNLVIVQEKKPPMCRYRGSTRIVCCPLDDDQYEPNNPWRKRIGYHQPTADSSVRESSEELPKVPEPPEPPGCPALPQPKLRSEVQHVAWLKCLEYQRYSSKCVSLNKQNTLFRRVDSCGAAGSSDQSAIGTRQATPTEFPHMAVLGFQDYDDKIVWRGSGSLISDKFVLTAAHVLMLHVEVKYVLLGAVDKTDPKSGVIYKVKQIIPYTDDSSRGYSTDIALLELQKRVMFNEFIRPACLPVPGQDRRPGLMIAGWGHSHRNELTEVLLTTHVTSNRRSCARRLGASFEPSKMICVQGNAGNPEFKGDSGSPLMTTLHNLKCSYSIAGVASLNSPRDATAVYINVSPYVNWITKTVWPHE